MITATLQREMVHTRGWLTLDQYGLAQSLAKITPGTGSLAFCAATAWMLRRWMGAVLAVLAASIPSAAFVVLDVGRDPVKLVLLYFLLLKAMVTTFSGTATLPVVRQDFVVRRGLLTDRDLNLAFTAGRSGPGPNGVYLVSVGYMVAGVPGACVGWLAPMARDALTGGFLAAIAGASFAVFSFTRIDSVWVILASAAVGLLGALVIH